MPNFLGELSMLSRNNQTNKSFLKWVFRGAFLRLFFPTTCEFCHRELYSFIGKRKNGFVDDMRMCGECMGNISFVDSENFCPKCSHPLNHLTCPACLEHSNKEELTNYENKSLFLYQGLGKQLIQSYKMEKHHSYASTIAFLTLFRYRDWIKSFDVIVPVTLAKKSLYERDFCQVTKIVYHLSRMTGVQVCPVVKKSYNSKAGSQHFKNAKERKINSKNIFYYPKGKKGLLNGKKVLVVDDVYTTGSTTEVIADHIRENNQTQEIKIFTFCRSVFD